MIIKRVVQASYNIVTALFLVGMAAFASYSFWSREPDWHHTILETRMEPDTIKVGEPLRTYVRVDRMVPASCAHELHRFISEYDTGVVIWSQITGAVADATGLQEIRRAIDVIPPLVPGVYGYSFRSITDCGRTKIVANSRIARFVVTN